MAGSWVLGCDPGTFGDLEAEAAFLAARSSVRSYTAQRQGRADESLPARRRVAVRLRRFGVDQRRRLEWGLHGLTQNWARSLRPHGVQVNNIWLGATDSYMMRTFAGFGYGSANQPPAELLAKWMDPEAVAEVMLELVDEGPEGRSGDNVGLWVGHPVVLPPPSSALNLPSGFAPDEVSAPLYAYMA
jgi:hypothetical protein